MPSARPAGAALITGASSGIGAELAKLFAADGHDLVLVARSRDRLEQLAQTLAAQYGIRARVLPADLANPSAPDEIFAQTQDLAIEVLVNNAGFGVRGPFVDADWTAEAHMLQVNVAALAHLTKLYLRPMIERRSGRILNVGSTAGFVPGPFMSIYYASKAFVNSFSHAIANEVEGTGVTVTLLCPGPTRTEFDQVAGAASTNLFRGPTMDAAEVARIGYEAMKAGRAEVIAGTRNRISMLGARIAPRTMLAGITRRLNSNAEPPRSS